MTPTPEDIVEHDAVWLRLLCDPLTEVGSALSDGGVARMERIADTLATLQADNARKNRDAARAMAAIVEAAGGEIRVSLSVLEKLPNLILERFEDNATMDMVYRTKAALSAQEEG